MLSAVPEPGLRRAEVVGVPVRAAITSLDRIALRAQARAHFGFADDAMVLLVFGGSARARSRSTEPSRPPPKSLPQQGISVLHAHGPKNTLDLREPADGDPPYVAVPYLDRMDLAYAAADLAICRSGAMTVAEVSAVGLPAVYVPLPIGNGEQRLNALPVVNAGGGLLVDDADLTPEFVGDTVAGLLDDEPRLTAMTAAAAMAGHRDAAQRVAEVALEVARRAADAKARHGERHTPLPPELAGCTWSASAERACPASRASCSTAAGWCRAPTPRSRARCCALRARGALVRIGHDESSLDLLPGGPTAVVSTHAAIPKTNPELVEARRRGIP